jgi:hypothetical protein
MYRINLQPPGPQVSVKLTRATLRVLFRGKGTGLCSNLFHFMGHLHQAGLARV